MTGENLDSCLRRNEQAGLHHYDAIMVGKQTLLLVAAPDNTEKKMGEGMEYRDVG